MKMNKIVVPVIVFLLFFTCFVFPGLSAARTARDEGLVSVVETASRAIVNIKTEEAAKKGSEPAAPAFSGGFSRLMRTIHRRRWKT